MRAGVVPAEYGDWLRDLRHSVAETPLYELLEHGHGTTRMSIENDKRSSAIRWKRLLDRAREARMVDDDWSAFRWRFREPTPRFCPTLDGSRCTFPVATRHPSVPTLPATSEGGSHDSTV